jgi:hypothetical protein
MRISGISHKGSVCPTVLVAGLLSLIPFSVRLAAQANQPGGSAGPDRLVLMVFDQMRPDYIDRFDLPNFKRLRRMGVNYPNAYVGHVTSETIVSHLVIPTGRLPKDLPWQDEILVDKKGLLGRQGAAYSVPSLGQEQLLKLLQTIPEDQILQNRLKKKFGGSIFAVGEKDYAAIVLGTPASDSIITFKKTEAKQCVPTGINVPPYVSGNERYSVDCSKDYGTARSSSPLDGAKYVPGDDPRHEGGDIWVADIALEIMNREKWTALLLTFGAIDKFGHMLGEQDGPRPRTFDSPYTFEEIIRIADRQLGRILDELQKMKLLERTVIVVTADHGGEGIDYYLGNWKKGPWGRIENEESRKPPFWIDRLLSPESGKVTACNASTAIRLWLEDRSIENKKRVIRAMCEISGVVEVYSLVQSDRAWSYEKVYSSLGHQSSSFRKWAEEHNLELVNTLASETAPDLIG